MLDLWLAEWRSFREGMFVRRVRGRLERLWLGLGIAASTRRCVASVSNGLMCSVGNVVQRIVFDVDTPHSI